MQSLQDIFGIWPSLSALAGDISEKADTVRKWKKFGRIPTAHWQPVILAAAKRGQHLTVDDLLKASAPWKQRADAAETTDMRQAESV